MKPGGIFFLSKIIVRRISMWLNYQEKQMRMWVTLSFINLLLLILLFNF